MFLRKTTAAVALALLTAGCSAAESGESSSDGAASGSGEAKNTTVTLVTHESWNAPKELLAKFTEQTGYTVKVNAAGDAGKVANQTVLTKGKPTGDVVFGIDNTFASRVTGTGALAPYTSSKLPSTAKEFALPDDEDAKELTPIDYGDVCVNVDDAWFEKKGKTPPKTFDDLTKPEYKGLMVTPGAATSSPGMAFLLATVGKYGEDGWQAYWKKLVANDVKITSGWSDAWNVDYTAGGGKGTRPIVLSYNSSPADTKEKSSAMLDTCFRQVEYAGVLEGAKNPEGAQALIDFMLGKDFQKELPANMYVFPVDTSVGLPKEWAGTVKDPERPITVDPAKITKNRDAWLRSWQDVTSR